MKILFVSPEVAPLAKTGGLADVAAALPKALAELGHDVRIVLPRYRSVDPAKYSLTPILRDAPVSLGKKTYPVSLLQGVLPNSAVPVYCVDQPSLFDREGLYQQAGGKDFTDNLERFSLFNEAIFALLPELGWQPDLVHAHDWQTGLLCARLAYGGRREPCWSQVRTVFTIHNLAYQGLFPAGQWPLTNLPDEAFSVGGLEFYNQISCLKAGLVCADLLTTVSPTYAQEIQTPELGCGLDGLLAGRARDLVGILNGIDPAEWDPRTDPHLPAHYSATEPAGKAACKLALQRQLGLPQHHVPLIGMIQRLTEQKGLDLFSEVATELLSLPLQFAVLGTGEPQYEQRLTELAARHPDKLIFLSRFDNALAHQIEAGADMFLMPSRYEPCGLNQMYSMRYGAVPIVRRTGGLADTVVDVAPQTLKAVTATGFVFEPYTGKALLEAVRRALTAFRDHDLWGRVMRAGMKRDFSWARSARDYVGVYERALRLRAEPGTPPAVKRKAGSQAPPPKAA